MTMANPLNFQPAIAQPSASIVADADCSVCAEPIGFASALYNRRGELVCDACSVRERISSSERDNARRLAIGTLGGGMLALFLGPFGSLTLVGLVVFAVVFAGLVAVSRAASLRLQTAEAREALGSSWRQYQMLRNLGLVLGGMALLLYVGRWGAWFFLVSGALAAR